MSSESPAPLDAPRFRPARLVPLAVIVLAGVAVVAVARHEGITAVALLERRAAIAAFVAEHRVVALAGVRRRSIR